MVVEERGRGREIGQIRRFVSGLSFRDIYGLKVIISVGEGSIGVAVREAGTREGGRHEGVNGWTVKGVFQAQV